MKKHPKLKIVLVFCAGFITPILVIILLLGYLTYNSSTYVTNFKTNMVAQIDTLSPNTSSLVALYKASTLDTDTLKQELAVQLITTKDDYITKIATLNSFKTERNEVKISNLDKIDTLVTNLETFKTNLATTPRNVNLIHSEITDVEAIISELKNNNLDHIATSFTELKNKLVAYEVSLTLDEEQKVIVKDAIVNNAKGKIENSDVVLKIKEFAPQVEEFLNFEILSNTEKQSILEMENEQIKLLAQTIKDEALKSETVITELENEIDTLNNEIATRDNDILLLQNTLATQDEQLSANTTTINEQAEIINTQSEIITTGSTELSELQTELLNSQTTNEMLQSQVDELTPVTYESFEDYIYDGTTSPFINDVNISKIKNVTTSRENTSKYQIITISASEDLTTSEINNIIAHLSTQLYNTNYEANISLIIHPNKVTIKLYPDSIENIDNEKPTQNI